MAKISILGGTGYAGAHIAAEAAARGHSVTSFSRSLPETTIEGVEYRTGSITDPDTIASAVQGADVVIAAVAARGEMAGKVRPAVAKLAAEASAAGVRVGVVGGAGSLYAVEGGPRLVDTPTFPAAVKPESHEQVAVQEDLEASPEDLDWFILTPAAMFGARNPGEKHGTYRTATDFLLADADGVSNISGADFGVAMVDEIEHRAHRRGRFHVAY